MNIFEFLGKPADYRKREKVTMKVKHFDEVPESRKVDEYIIQQKFDGNYSFLVVSDGKAELFGRTGLNMQNTDAICGCYDNAPDGLYVNEVCCDFCSLEELSGILNPNRTSPLSEQQEAYLKEFYLVFHDYITIDEFLAGETDRGYEERLEELESIMPIRFVASDLIADFVIPSIKVRRDEIQFYIDRAIKHGQEGIVIKHPEAMWVAGHKGWRMMKLVRGVSYDLLCIGYEEGKGKRKGMVANAFFPWKKHTKIKVDLGKGWTDEKRIDFYLNPEKYVGQIMEVYALQESSKGKLRLPKVGEVRHDKTAPDV